MSIQPLRVACLLLSAGACFAARAESFASSASSAGSASSASVSDSIHDSSNSSSNRQVAEGDYRIVEVAELAARPDRVRLRLREAAGTATFSLDLPRETFERQRLVAGEMVGVRHRVYGLEFARADTRTAFFLVLDDAWARDLESRPVALPAVPNPG